MEGVERYELVLRNVEPKDESQFTPQDWKDMPMKLESNEKFKFTSAISPRPTCGDGWLEDPSSIKKGEDTMNTTGEEDYLTDGFEIKQQANVDPTGDEEYRNDPLAIDDKYFINASAEEDNLTDMLVTKEEVILNCSGNKGYKKDPLAIDDEVSTNTTDDDNFLRDSFTIKQEDIINKTEDIVYEKDPLAIDSEDLGHLLTKDEPYDGGDLQIEELGLLSSKEESCKGEDITHQKVPALYISTQKGDERDEYILGLELTEEWDGIMGHYPLNTTRHTEGWTSSPGRGNETAILAYFS